MHNCPLQGNIKQWRELGSAGSRGHRYKSGWSRGLGDKHIWVKSRSSWGNNPCGSLGEGSKQQVKRPWVTAKHTGTEAEQVEQLRLRGWNAHRKDQTVWGPAGSCRDSGFCARWVGGLWKTSSRTTVIQLSCSQVSSLSTCSSWAHIQKVGTGYTAGPIQ